MNIYTYISKTPLEKSQQHELARRLLAHALQKEFGITKMPPIAIGAHGKPYFTDSDIFFNYSHCKFAVVCAVSKNEIGVDVQDLKEIKKVKPAVIKRVCCDEETKLIKTDEDFIKIWAMKEAYAKFTGKGFAQGFKSIDTTEFPAEWVIKINNLFIAVHCQLSAVNCFAVPQLVRVGRL